jgi:hypothetical protein
MSSYFFGAVTSVKARIASTTLRLRRCTARDGRYFVEFGMRDAQVDRAAHVHSEFRATSERKQRCGRDHRAGPEIASCRHAGIIGPVAG